MHSTGDSDQGRPSTNLYSNQLRKDAPPKHPIQSFVKLVKKNESDFKSDILLCPGDITNKIDPQGYITGWSFLEEMKSAIGADGLYATIGNHDVDSRRSNKQSLPFTVAKSIKENYPIDDPQALDDFWLNNYCVIEKENFALLIYNSSHSHLNYDDATRAIIDLGVIDKMRERCKQIGQGKIKIALCHHHPIAQGNLDGFDSDVIQNGEKFLEMLSQQGFSMLIHGHKHEAKIRKYAGIIVFGAGSFSSLDNLRETESDNVLHVITFDGLKKGIIKTYTYGVSNGWHIKPSFKFPPITGFGFIGEIDSLALEISQWQPLVDTDNQLFKDLVRAFPDVKFLLPNERDQLFEQLRNAYAIDITYDVAGLPINISKVIV